MFVTALGAAFGLTFIAELGDKTQIAILNLSARYGILPVFVGAAAAFVVLNAIAVSAGLLLYRLVPHDVIRYVSAGIFIVFGIISIVRSGGSERETRPARNPLLTAFLLVALLEFGDKTQLALVALTARYDAPLAVFLGGTAALWLTSIIGAVVGEGLGRVIPFKWVEIGSGVVFIAFGILIAVSVI